MFSRIISAAALLGIVSFATATFAQTPGQPTPAAPATAPAVSGSAPAASDLGAPDPDAVLLGQLRKDIDKKKLEAESLGVELQIQDSRSKLDGSAGAGASAAIPELIGLYGTGDRVTAEFIVGSNTILTAKNGEWVSTDWQIESILTNGVVLKHRGSKERRTVLFGRRSAAGALPAGAPFPDRMTTSGAPGVPGAPSMQTTAPLRPVGVPTSGAVNGNAAQ